MNDVLGYNPPIYNVASFFIGLVSLSLSLAVCVSYISDIAFINF